MDGTTKTGVNVDGDVVYGGKVLVDSVPTKASHDKTSIFVKSFVAVVARVVKD